MSKVYTQYSNHNINSNEALICNKITSRFIKTLRSNNNISHSELIKQSGITLNEQDLIAIENEQLEIDAINFYKVMCYFNVNVDKFFLLSSIFIDLFQP